VNRRRFVTQARLGKRRQWVEVSGPEWDRLSESQREILIIRGEGTFLVGAEHLFTEGAS
jgi:hypothetical protein